MSESNIANSIYKNIGLITIILFVLFIIIRTLNFQARVLEGFTNNEPITETEREKIPESIDSSTSMIQDVLRIDKYSNTYEDILINLENNLNYNILGEIINKSEQLSTNPSDESSQKIITSLNSMKAFKDTLNDSMQFLNKMSSEQDSGTSSGSDNTKNVKDMSSAFSSKLNLTGIKKGPSSLFSSFDD
jgi:hypothetical protein